MFRLSQAHLNLLEKCPPKFKQTFLDKVSSLPNPETEDRQSWGRRFHLLMQQRELGLPIDLLLAEDADLDRSLKALIAAAPELLNTNSKQKREAEHSRTLSFNNYLLTAIYDLLIAESDRAMIIDWKTYLKPEKKQYLAFNWQTRLYLYVLVETSEYTPEQISMTYWFVKLPKKPQSHTFNYSQKQHQQTKEDLTRLLTNLDLWLAENNELSFCHKPDCETNCHYRDEFYKKDEQQSDRSLQQKIAEIAEIPL